jgi:hypothetical protein
MAGVYRETAEQLPDIGIFHPPGSNGIPDPQFYFTVGIHSPPLYRIAIETVAADERKGLFVGDDLEHCRWVAFGFDEGPDGFDFAGFADEKGAADDAHEFAAHELFFLPSAELLDGLMGGITEQGKIETQLGLEPSLGFDGIGAHAEDGDAELVEVFFCVAKLGRFNGSTGSVGFGVEEEEDLPAGEVLEGDFFAFVGWETEGRGIGAYFEHRIPLF